MVTIMIAIDMLSLKQQGAHKIRFREAILWSVIWITVSCLFAVWLYFAVRERLGADLAQEKVMEFFTAYLLEKSLSVDNIFVFLMVFVYFKIPDEYQHRILLYGVLGAIIMRIVMILLGVVLVQKFAWILYVFGAFLMYSGIKMMLPEKEDRALEETPLYRTLRKILPVSQQNNGDKFFTIENGKRLATPLFLVLLIIESSDVLFAVDSIPAIFSVTSDPFILITSNICAILGLRAMYFLLAGASNRFVLLQYGLAFVLFFIGVKMLIASWVHIPTAVSLAVVFGAIGASMLISLKVKPQGDGSKIE
ncbi:MAG: TerC family protein [Neisseriaceae bacterium]|nr:TerC family protein [Neisseriaceae bacterium]